MTNYPILSHTPIKETIFTISHSETISAEILKLFSEHEYISQKYDYVRDGFSTQVSAKEGEKPETNVKFDGYILKCSKENTVIQAREGSFSFHKVNEYEKFENLVSELFLLWNILTNSFKGNLSINNISIRYVNFIEYENEKISDLIKILPSNPFTENLNQSFVHLNFQDHKYESVDINIVTAYPSERDSKKCIVLDIILSKKQNYISSINLLTKDFATMKEIKNFVFFTTITDYTLKKYL